MRNKWSTVFGTLQNQEIGMVKNRLKYAPLICISTKKAKITKTKNAVYIPLKSKMTCKDCQVARRKWILSWHQLQYLVEYHMLVIQNHIYQLVDSQPDLQEARKKKWKKNNTITNKHTQNHQAEILLKVELHVFITLIHACSDLYPWK